MIYLQNKYTRWYKELILKAKARTVLEGYSEQHHIIPTSLGGENLSSNVVRLTAREHFIAHAFLVRMTAGRAYYKMNNALIAMINDKRKKAKRYLPSSRVIARARENFASSQREKMLSLPKEERKAFGQRQRGIPHTSEAKAKISAGNRGKAISETTKLKMKIAHQNRQPLSAETKLAISNANKGRVASAETRLKLSIALKGKVVSVESKLKMSASKLGVKPNSETRQKMALAKLGKAQPDDVKAKKSLAMLAHYDTITIEQQYENSKRISEAKRGRSNGNKGQTRSDETKLKMSEARKAYWKAKRAEKTMGQSV